jgi:anti-sigma factor RsiW
MYECSEIHKLLHPALDRELDIKESLRVQNHLTDCAPCRERLLDEQDLLGLFPDTFTPSPAPESLRQAVGDALSREARRLDQARRRWRALLSPSMLVAVALLVVFFAIPRPQVPEVVKIAMAEHRLLMMNPGLLPIRSHDAPTVARSLERRLPFPVYIPANASADVRLVGAAVKSAPIPSAVLAYQVNGSPVSLLVTTPHEMPFSSADTLTFKNILFRTTSLAGLHVLEWSNHRHTYVLVACRDTPVDSLPFAVLSADGS